MLVPNARTFLAVAPLTLVGISMPMIAFLEASPDTMAGKTSWTRVWL